jgi:hypothetical protein
MGAHWVVSCFTRAWIYSPLGKLKMVKECTFNIYLILLATAGEIMGKDVLIKRSWPHKLLHIPVGNYCPSLLFVLNSIWTPN